MTKKAIAFLLLFVFAASTARCQDTTTTQKKTSAFAIGVGIPSGLNLSFTQKLTPGIFLSLSAGALLDRYTFSIGSGFRVGGETSSSNIACQYTITSRPPVSFTRIQDKVFSIYYHFFNFDSSPFFWGIGIVLPIGHYDWNIPLPFVEIGIRLFSF